MTIRSPDDYDLTDDDATARSSLAPLTLASPLSRSLLLYGFADSPTLFRSWNLSPCVAHALVLAVTL